MKIAVPTSTEFQALCGAVMVGCIAYAVLMKDQKLVGIIGLSWAAVAVINS